MQSKIDASSDNDIVTIPAGNFTWTSTVTISGKGICLQGAGGGFVQGSSTTSLDVGTGSKVFTLQSNSVIRAFVNGESICARYKAVAANFMCGTVTSWSDPTLTLNITTSGGSGTLNSWTFSQDGATIVNHGAGTSTMLDVVDDTTHPVQVSGMQVTHDDGEGDVISIDGGATGKPAVFYDIRCSMETGGSGACFEVVVNRGIAYRIYADCGFDWKNNSNSECTAQIFSFKNQGPTEASWSTVSTMGTADTNGDANFYIEDSYLEGLNQSVMDLDDNSRTVSRHIVFDNSEIGSHGQDTSDTGNRHYEIYDNLFIFSTPSGSVQTPNLGTFVFLRGGTGVITGNVMPNITSSDWGNKPEIRLAIFQLGRDAGPYGCWGNGSDPQWGAMGWPVPRQIGQGYVDGSGTTDPTWGYRGDLEPLYVWSNSGGLAAPSIQGFTPPTCSTPDSETDYIQIDRDYYYSTDTTAAKPGWTRYTYPHPLRPS